MSRFAHGKILVSSEFLFLHLHCGNEKCEDLYHVKFPAIRYTVVMAKGCTPVLHVNIQLRNIFDEETFVME